MPQSQPSATPATVTSCKEPKLLTPAVGLLECSLFLSHLRLRKRIIVCRHSHVNLGRAEIEQAFWQTALYEFPTISVITLVSYRIAQEARDGGQESPGR